jgi:DNA-binding response OmpR family regulator
VAEDDPFTLDLLRQMLDPQAYICTFATHASEAWSCLQNAETPFDLVLLDRRLPDLDGIEILHRMKQLPAARQVPVIMQTAMSSSADIEQGLQAGAYYYLVKPFSPETLVAILTAATRDHHQHLRLLDQVFQAARTLGHLKQAEFEFRTLSEANDIAALLAKVTPTPEQVVLGLAELMINAVEHGNLGIGYEEKGQLLLHGRLFEEIEARLLQPEYSGKWATLRYERTADGYHFLVRDHGQGFDWQKFLHLSPERAFHLNGRGIAISARCCFSRLTFHGCGNAVEAFVQA